MIINEHKGMKKLISLLVISLLITGSPAINIKASNASSEQKFRQLYLNLLESGDNSQQDISDLGLPYMTCYSIINDVKKNEGFMAYHSYNVRNFLAGVETTGSGEDTKLMKFQLSHTDEGFQERYAKVKEMVAQVQANLDEKMTDLDKLLWFHEYVVENIRYENTGLVENHLGGTTLVNGYGVCQGYAGALMIFLKAENIPCETVAGGEHEWVAAKIDGEWYQIDPTWDDTRSSRVGTHYFLMRNDEEFSKTLSMPHSESIYSDILKEESTDSISTSTKYTDWYVHDVWNRMYYYDGYWYYIFDSALRKNNIEGTEETILAKGINMKITGLENGVLNYSINGQVQALELEKDAVVEITPTPVPASPTNTQAPTKTPIPTMTPTVTPRITEGVKPTAGVTEGASATPTVTPRITEEVKPTVGVTEGASVTPTVTPRITEEVKPTVGVTEGASATPTVTPRITEEVRPTLRVTEGASATPTVTPKVTESATIPPVVTEVEKPESTAAPTVSVTEPSKATVTITKQKTTPTPTIKVGKPVIKSITNKKGKKVKIVLKKKVSGAKGYEVVYSKDKKFKKSVKKVRFTGKSKTIGKLSKNKTYYIKVRAYTKDAKGKRIYGAYSKVKKVKIKK